MVVAVAMVRDEVDIIEQTVRQMSSQVDALIVADNRSVDGTREKLDSLAGELPLVVVEESQEEHYHAHAINRLAARATGEGAEWIVPFDADEWVHSALGRLADVLAECSGEVAIAPSHMHVATARDDPDEADPLRRIGWREREAQLLPKIACRALPGLRIHDGNHFADYGRRPRFVRGRFALRHFPYRSPAQFERKIRNGAAAIAATNLGESVCFHWRRYGAILDSGGPPALERVFYERHFRQDPGAEVVVDGETLAPLVFDPVAAVEAG